MCGGVLAWLPNIRALMDTRASGAILVSKKIRLTIYGGYFTAPESFTESFDQQQFLMDTRSWDSG